MQTDGSTRPLSRHIIQHRLQISFHALQAEIVSPIHRFLRHDSHCRSERHETHCRRGSRPTAHSRVCSPHTREPAPQSERCPTDRFEADRGRARLETGPTDTLAELTDDGRFFAAVLALNALALAAARYRCSPMSSLFATGRNPHWPTRSAHPPPEENPSESRLPTAMSAHSHPPQNRPDDGRETADVP